MKKYFCSFLIFLGLFLSNEAYSQNYFFIPNKGQWNSDIVCAGTANGINLVIAESGIYFNHQRFDKNFSNENDLYKEHQLQSSNFKMNFLNSLIQDKIESGKVIYEDKNDFIVSFLEIGKMVDSIEVYKKIKIKDIYKGVDLIFYFDSFNIRYDFKLSENSNINTIDIEFQGAELVESSNNKFLLKTKLGFIENNDIKSYLNQTGEEIETEICRNRNGISFKLPENYQGFDKTIDPLVYASYFCPNNEYLTFIDAQYFDDQYLIAASNEFGPYIYNDTLLRQDSKTYGSGLYFLSKDLKKLNKITYLTSGSNNSILIDDSGNLITLVGYESPPNYPKGRYLVNVNLKSGKLNGATLINASDVTKIRKDKNNKINITGIATKESKIFPFVLTDNAFSNMKEDTTLKTYGFIATFNETCDSLIFSSYTGLTFESYDVATDKDDNKYVVGYSNIIDTNFYDTVITSDNLEPNHQFTFLLKISPDYKLLKKVLITHSRFSEMLINGDEIILSGDSFLNMIPTQQDVIGINMLKDNFHTDITFMKLNLDLKLLTMAKIPYTKLNEQNPGMTSLNRIDWTGDQMKIDKKGNIAVTGVFSGWDYPIVNDIAYRALESDWYNEPHTQTDAFVTIINPEMTKILYSTLYGGRFNGEWGAHIDFEDSIITIIGPARSPDLKLTYDASQIQDCFGLFIAKFNTNINVGVDSENLNHNTTLYPNPATDYITINPGNNGLKPFAETDEQVEIYNSFGELVMQDVQHLEDVGHLRRIDVSHLPVGLYFVKNGNKVEKFVKM